MHLDFCNMKSIVATWERKTVVDVMFKIQNERMILDCELMYRGIVLSHPYSY